MGPIHSEMSPAEGSGWSTPFRLLMLEDDAGDAELAERAMRRGGLNCILCRTATRDAFEQALDEFNPDIVLVDFQVPGFGGLEAVRMVKESRTAAPAILLTGALSDEAAGDFLKLGIDDYVLKDRLARLPAAVIGALSKARSTRARLRAEAARDELARILECAQDGVIGVNLAGKVTAWNAGATSIYQQAADDVMGLPIREALGAYYTAQIDAALARVERDAAVVSLDVECSNGHELMLSMKLSPIRDETGKFRGTSFIIRDITNERKLRQQLSATTAQLAILLHEIADTNLVMQREIEVRRRAEAEAAEARKEAERANLAKTSYLSDVSHEIRTPMTSVIGFADLLLNSPLSDEQSSKVRYMREAAHALLSIVNDLVDISAIESGRLRLAAEPTDLRAVVEAVLATVRPGATAKKLALCCSISPDLPACVSTDAHRVRQILLNLIGNAVKFTNHGTITVTVECRYGDGEPMVYFAVTDTGVGIPLDKQQNLFTEFYRVGHNGTREQEGSGLGLAISRRLAIMMGGSIGVISAPQAGSTFWVELPMRAIAQTPAMRQQDVGHGLGRKGRILVAEDLPMNQMIIAEMLESAEHEVTVVADGVSAIAALGAGTFDLVLMDMEMPVMGGVDTTRVARSMEQTSGVPIVALTANAMTAQIASCREAGMDDYLSKPIDRELLLRTADKWIGQRSSYAIPKHEAHGGASGCEDLVTRFGAEKARRFAAMAREQMTHMLRLLPACNDAVATERAAHDLVSVAGNIGMLELSAHSRRLMTALQSEPEDVALAAKVLHVSLQAAILALDAQYSPVGEAERQFGAE